MNIMELKKDNQNLLSETSNQRNKIKHYHSLFNEKINFTIQL